MVKPRPKICPKCGSADCHYIKDGTASVKCTPCGYVGVRRKFSGGGPQRKMSYPKADAPTTQLVGGGLWRIPIRYGDEDYD